MTGTIRYVRRKNIIAKIPVITCMSDIGLRHLPSLSGKIPTLNGKMARPVAVQTIIRTSVIFAKK